MGFDKTDFLAWVVSVAAIYEGRSFHSRALDIGAF